MNIEQLESYNLADAVKFNDRLNPRLFGKDEHLLPDVRRHLLGIADDFREFLGVNGYELRDITISGSNAAYTYTPHSDIDLHLVVDLPQMNNEVYKELFDAKKYEYNDKHDIKISGYDVELYVQDVNQTHVSQGIYSVLNNDWVEVPRRQKHTINDLSTRSKYQDVQQRIKQAIASDDLELMSDLKHKISDMRKAGLAQNGEFGPENLAFKMLRTQGDIGRLAAALVAGRDQELSLVERRPVPVKYGFAEESEPVTAAVKDIPKRLYWSSLPEGLSLEDKMSIFEAFYINADLLESIDEDASISPDGVNPTTKMILEKERISTKTILADFVKFCGEQLGLEKSPAIQLRRDPQWSARNKTFGRFNTETGALEVSIGNRHVMDVLRTVAHELVHQRQSEVEDMPDTSGETGSKYENQANALAGVLMRDYAELHPEHFDSVTEGASGYIPTKAQARDPRFVMALTKDVRPGEVARQANKLGLQVDSKGAPALLLTEDEDNAVMLTRLGRFHPGKDTLADIVPERQNVKYALHPDKWEATFYSLTMKDSDKLKFFGPKKIAITAGTLVGDMAIANQFYRAKTPELRQRYAEEYKQSLRPYPVDISQYRMPELLIPGNVEQLDELSFLGSPCTQDCSGHRAGYDWSKARGGVDAGSWSPSFNNGAGLAKAGK